MSLDVFAQSTYRLQYRRRWADPWKWDDGTVGIGPWESAGGNRTGSASFVSFDASASMREEGAAVCPLRLGWFVRIASRARQSNGTDPQKVYWTGYLAEREHMPMGGVEARKDTPAATIGRVNWQALGLGGLLAGLDLHRVWRGCGPGSSSVRVFESPVRFGYQKRRDYQNRDGRNVLYRDRALSFDTTMHNIVMSMLDWHLHDLGDAGARVKRFPHWPDFTLTGLTAALDWDLADVELGGNVLEALAGILNPRRGLFFTVEPPGISEDQTGPVKIVIQTFANAGTEADPDATIDIPLPEGGTRTIPNANNRITLEANKPHRSLTWAPPPAPRRTTIHGHRDVRIVSLRWSRSAGSETGALARTWASTDDAKAGRTEVEYQNVFRTWTFRPGWDGTCQGTTAEPLLTTPMVAGSLGSPDIVHGAGGMNGVLTTASGTVPFPDMGLEFADHIPMPSQAADDTYHLPMSLKDWVAGTSGIVLDTFAPPLRPMAFVVKGTTWTRLNVSIAFPDAITVTLGSGPTDAAKIKAALADDTCSLVITCAVIMPNALAVSHIPAVAADADTLINSDRCRSITWAERIVLHKGTVVGLNPGAAPTAPTTDRTVRDDLGYLRSVLVMARLNAERSAGGVYTDAAELDTSIKPGQFVEKASKPATPGSYIDIGYVITSVRHDPSIGAAERTVATLETALIDMEPTT